MRNPFKFKQFTVHQQHSAMPVTTDACVFGALIGPVDGETLLDIGCGTGLLSLMMAQRFAHLSITGVELDPMSAEDAKNNVKSSPWASRISIVNTDIQGFESEVLFDTVICNPPFFHNQLESTSSRKRDARHTSSLSHNALLAHAARLLADNGSLWLLIPLLHFQDIQHNAQLHGLYLKSVTNICSNPDRQPHVVCAQWTRVVAAMPQPRTIFHFENGIMSEVYRKLLSDFYLNL